LERRLRIWCAEKTPKLLDLAVRQEQGSLRFCRYVVG
jgi:hypothetical protein